ncbi:MAG: glycosyltransferase family 4 protein [Sphingomicrobium sp.]
MTSARICLVYDCLFPWTIGGAERWYRNLGERLAEAGHEVTYLTLKQWDDEPPQIPGVKVIAVGPRMALYRDGKRRILPPLRFGFGVFWHLIRHRRDYDWLHTASFPYFSLLSAGLMRPFSSYRIAVDWHEVWSLEYWREYLGALGFIGSAVQRLCARVPQIAYTFSALHRARLNAIGVRDVTLLTGEYAGREHHSQTSAGTPRTVVYAGRFIREKRLDLLVDALALVMEQDSTLRAELYGQGPDFQRIKDRVHSLGLAGRIGLPGFVDAGELEDAMCAAIAIVQPSAREGYGMVVVEASARGVPVIVVAAPDNAATELVDNGRNGFVVHSPEPPLLADAIRACVVGGRSLRSATRQWYRENQERLSLAHSLEQVASNYSLERGPQQFCSEMPILALSKSGAA